MTKLRYTGARTGIAETVLPKLGTVKRGDVVDVDVATATRWAESGNFTPVDGTLPAGTTVHSPGNKIVADGQKPARVRRPRARRPRAKKKE